MKKPAERREEQRTEERKAKLNEILRSVRRTPKQREVTTTVATPKAVKAQPERPGKVETVEDDVEKRRS